MIRVPLTHAHRWLLHKQHLDAHASNIPLETIVEDCLGLHGTEMLTPYLSLRARMSGFQRDQLYDALYRRRSLGRIRCVRRTLYVLTQAQITTMHAATLGLLEQECQAYLDFVGVDEATVSTVAQQILTELGDEGLTARELGQRLDWDKSSRRVINVLCNRRILIRGEPRKSWRDRMSRYYRFRSYLPEVELGCDPQEALCELVTRYLRAFGPATLDDLAWWTKLTKRDLQRALAGITGVIEIAVDPLGEGYLLFGDELEALSAMESASAAPRISVLPVLDGMLMGYKDRRRFFDDSLRPLTTDRSGNVTTLVLVDGYAAAVWDYRDKPKPTVWWHPLRPLEPSLHEEIEREVAAVGTWIADGPATLIESADMEPLSASRAGRFMHPLSPKA